MHILMAQPLLVVSIDRFHMFRALFLLLVKSGLGVIAALRKSKFGCFARGCTLLGRPTMPAICV